MGVRHALPEEYPQTQRTPRTSPRRDQLFEALLMPHQPVTTTLVVAGNYKQFKDFYRRNPHIRIGYPFTGPE